MIAVKEETIVEIMDHLEEKEDDFFQTQEELANAHPAISALLTDENLDLLKEEEYDLLWFVVTIVYQSFKVENGAVEAIDLEELGAIEEKNWSLLGENASTPFRDRLDVFFDNYPQEDLLAFIEDSFESDEELEISGPSREVLFITAKSCLDAFIQKCA